MNRDARLLSSSDTVLTSNAHHDDHGQNELEGRKQKSPLRAPLDISTSSRQLPNNTEEVEPKPLNFLDSTSMSTLDSPKPLTLPEEIEDDGLGALPSIFAGNETFPVTPIALASHSPRKGLGSRSSSSHFLLATPTVIRPIHPRGSPTSSFGLSATDSPRGSLANLRSSPASSQSPHFRGTSPTSSPSYIHSAQSSPRMFPHTLTSSPAYAPLATTSPNEATLYYAALATPSPMDERPPEEWDGADNDVAATANGAGNAGDDYIGEDDNAYDDDVLNATQVRPISRASSLSCTDETYYTAVYPDEDGSDYTADAASLRNIGFPYAASSRYTASVDSDALTARSASDDDNIDNVDNNHNNLVSTVTKYPSAHSDRPLTVDAHTSHTTASAYASPTRLHATSTSTPASPHAPAPILLPQSPPSPTPSSSANTSHTTAITINTVSASARGSPTFVPSARSRTVDTARDGDVTRGDAAGIPGHTHANTQARTDTGMDVDVGLSASMGINSDTAVEMSSAGLGMRMSDTLDMDAIARTHTNVNANTSTDMRLNTSGGASAAGDTSEGEEIREGTQEKSGETEAEAKAGEQEEEEVEKEERVKLAKTVTLLDLYRYASTAEMVLLFISVLCALGCGAMLPCFALLFGDIVDAGATTNIQQTINESALMFVYLGVGMGAAGLIGMGGMGWVGERVSGRVRVLYVEAVLRQEIAWHEGIDSDDDGEEEDEEEVEVELTVREDEAAIVSSATQPTDIPTHSNPTSPMASRTAIDAAPTSRSPTSAASPTSALVPAPASSRPPKRARFSSLRGDIASRVNNDLLLFQQGIGEKAALLCVGAAGFIAGMVIALYQGWQLTLVVLAAVPALMIVSLVMGVRVAGIAAEEQQYLNRAASLATAYFTYIKQVHTHALTRLALRQVEQPVMAAAAAGRSKDRTQGVGVGFFLLFLMSIYALGLWYGAELIAQGSDSWPGVPYSGGVVLAVFNSLIIAVLCLGNAAPHLVHLSSARTLVYPIYKVIQRRSRIDPADPRGVRVDSETLTGRVWVDNVVFHYPARPEVAVLDGMSVEVKAQSSLGIIGGSGSGKSTIIQLLERMYDVDDGGIYVEVKCNADTWARRQQVLQQSGRGIYANTNAAVPSNTSNSAGNSSGGSGGIPSSNSNSAKGSKKGTGMSMGVGMGTGMEGVTAGVMEDVWDWQWLVDRHYARTNNHNHTHTHDAHLATMDAARNSYISRHSTLPEPAPMTVWVDIRDLHLSSWRRCLSLITQQGKLFPGTVATNITQGNSPCACAHLCPTEEDEALAAQAGLCACVITASRLACAHAFITGLPQGYHTDVGACGGLISGGQRQRLTIARALHRGGAFLLCDEHTSALDYATELEVHANIHGMLRTAASRGKQMTCIVIAHRYSALRGCHEVINMERGKVTSVDKVLLGVGGMPTYMPSAAAFTIANVTANAVAGYQYQHDAAYGVDAGYHPDAGYLQNAIYQRDAGYAADGSHTNLNTNNDSDTSGNVHENTTDATTAVDGVAVAAGAPVSAISISITAPSSGISASTSPALSTSLPSPTCRPSPADSLAPSDPLSAYSLPDASTEGSTHTDATAVAQTHTADASPTSVPSSPPSQPSSRRPQPTVILTPYQPPAASRAHTHSTSASASTSTSPAHTATASTSTTTTTTTVPHTTSPMPVITTAASPSVDLRTSLRSSGPRPSHMVAGDVDFSVDSDEDSLCSVLIAHARHTATHRESLLLAQRDSVNMPTIGHAHANRLSRVGVDTHIHPPYPEHTPSPSPTSISSHAALSSDGASTATTIRASTHHTHSHSHSTHTTNSSNDSAPLHPVYNSADARSGKSHTHAGVSGMGPLAIPSILEDDDDNDSIAMGADAATEAERHAVARHSIAASSAFPANRSPFAPGPNSPRSLLSAEGRLSRQSARSPPQEGAHLSSLRLATGQSPHASPSRSRDSLHSDRASGSAGSSFPPIPVPTTPLGAAPWPRRAVSPPPGASPSSTHTTHNAIHTTQTADVTDATPSVGGGAQPLQISALPRGINTREEPVLRTTNNTPTTTTTNANATSGVEHQSNAGNLATTVDSSKGDAGGDLAGKTGVVAGSKEEQLPKVHNARLPPLAPTAALATPTGYPSMSSATSTTNNNNNNPSTRAGVGVGVGLLSPQSTDMFTPFALHQRQFSAVSVTSAYSNTIGHPPPGMGMGMMNGSPQANGPPYASALIPTHPSHAASAAAATAGYNYPHYNHLNHFSHSHKHKHHSRAPPPTSPIHDWPSRPAQPYPYLHPDSLMDTPPTLQQQYTALTYSSQHIPHPAWDVDALSIASARTMDSVPDDSDGASTSRTHARGRKNALERMGAPLRGHVSAQAQGHPYLPAAASIASLTLSPFRAHAHTLTNASTNASEQGFDRSTSMSDAGDRDTLPYTSLPPGLASAAGALANYRSDASRDGALPPRPLAFQHSPNGLLPPSHYSHLAHAQYRSPHAHQRTHTPTHTHTPTPPAAPSLARAPSVGLGTLLFRSLSTFSSHSLSLAPILAQSQAYEGLTDVASPRSPLAGSSGAPAFTRAPTLRSPMNRARATTPSALTPAHAQAYAQVQAQILALAHARATQQGYAGLAPTPMHGAHLLPPASPTPTHSNAIPLSAHAFAHGGMFVLPPSTPTSPSNPANPFYAPAQSGPSSSPLSPHSTNAAAHASLFGSARALSVAIDDTRSIADGRGTSTAGSLAEGGHGAGVNGSVRNGWISPINGVLVPTPHHIGSLPPAHGHTRGYVANAQHSNSNSNTAAGTGMGVGASAGGQLSLASLGITSDDNHTPTHPHNTPLSDLTLQLSRAPTLLPSPSLAYAPTLAHAAYAHPSLVRASTLLSQASLMRSPTVAAPAASPGLLRAPTLLAAPTSLIPSFSTAEPALAQHLPYPYHALHQYQSHTPAHAMLSPTSPLPVTPAALASPFTLERTHSASSGATAYTALPLPADAHARARKQLFWRAHLARSAQPLPRARAVWVDGMVAGLEGPALQDDPSAHADADADATMGMGAYAWTPEEVEMVLLSAPHNSRLMPLIPHTHALTLGGLLRPHVGLVLLSCLFALLEGCVFPLFSLVIAEISQVYFLPDVSELQSRAGLYAGVLVGIGGGALVLVSLKMASMAVVCHDVSAWVKSVALESLLRRPVGWHELAENAPGMLVSQVSVCPGTVKNFLADKFTSVMVVLGNMICTVLVCFLGSSEGGYMLALVSVCAVLPVLAACAVVQSVLAASSSKATQQRLAEGGALAAEAAANIRAVAAYNCEEEVWRAVCVCVSTSVSAGQRSAFARAVGYGCAQMGVFFSYALMFWYGGVLIRDGRLAMVDLIRIFMAVQTCSNQVGQLVSVGAEWTKCKQALALGSTCVDKHIVDEHTRATGGQVGVVEELEDQEEEVEVSECEEAKGLPMLAASPTHVTAEDNITTDAHTTALTITVADTACAPRVATLVTTVVTTVVTTRALPLDPLFTATPADIGGVLSVGTPDTTTTSDTDINPVGPSISFHNVWFAYPTRPVYVLRGTSLHIPPRCKAALVGESGCGKSSLFGLLLRLYDPDNSHATLAALEAEEEALMRDAAELSYSHTLPHTHADTTTEDADIGAGGAGSGDVELTAVVVHSEATTDPADTNARNNDNNATDTAADAQNNTDSAAATSTLPALPPLNTDEDSNTHARHPITHAHLALSPVPSPLRDGAVQIGGIDISHIPLAVLRKLVGIVWQDPPILPLSVLENVRCGRPASEVSREDVMEACRVACIHDLIVSKFPQGYDTDMSSVVLSGGERARLGIARALAGKPQILLMDEATAALDSDTEQMVLSKLKIATKHMTVITIAHKLSSVRDCDLIFVMRDGLVAEQGNHAQLMHQQGLYAQLVHSGGGMGMD